MPADVAGDGEQGQQVQGFLLAVGTDDDHAVVGADGPVLGFDFHTGFLRHRVEVMRAFRGIFDVLRAFLGEAEEGNIVAHGDVLSVVCWSLELCSDFSRRALTYVKAAVDRGR